MPVPAIPPKSLLRKVGRAIGDYHMIQDGDRILLGVSGGKDSLSLLQILLHLQRYAPVRFELGILTVDPQVEGFEPAVLLPYYQMLGVPYLFERQAIVDQAQTRIDGDSFCAYCSRMKRGIMYRLCRERGYNVLALGQHLDDLAESFLMSACYNGRLWTMRAHYRNDKGDLRIIRPLVYCRERQTAEFAKSAGLPIVPDSCPACFTAPTQRVRSKALLAQMERDNPLLFPNLLHALRPLMQGDIEAKDSRCPH
ncbi:MAG: ATP-binding protein [Pseudomonadota bacterium]